MEFLRLSVGLLLPWLGGALWLMFVESRFSQAGQPNRPRQIGYGLFLGYAVLFAAVMTGNAWVGHVSWGGTMLFLALFAGGGGLALWFGRPAAPTSMPVTGSSLGTAQKILLLVLALWIGLHLLFVVIEVLSQPVYPWDAWQTWVYRAKAWFLAGRMTPIVDMPEWAAVASPDIYAITGSDYPLFASVIPYWAALSLGRWSETLVNLPVLLAGMAIGLALYGQCREAGLSVLSSALACYLLFSIPLFGTHIALAGYADIWMAGFAGLGFIALMRGAVAGRRSQTVLGLVMVALALGVKNEAAVWFLAALLMQALLAFRWRTVLLAALTLLAAALAAWWLGYTHVELPLAGTLGIVNNRLEIPFIGSFALEAHNVWRVYWDNFFAMGSWNLLWVLVGSALVLAAIHGKRGGCPAIWAGAAFILVFVSTQLFIFGFTDQAIWAGTYTAINRLPIHFAPALLFASVLIFRQCLVQAVETPSSGEPGRA